MQYKTLSFLLAVNDPDRREFSPDCESRVLSSRGRLATLTGATPFNMSWFANVEAAAPIEVFALTQAFNDDPHPQKVNLSVGGKK